MSVKKRKKVPNFQIPYPKKQSYDADYVDFFNEFWGPLVKVFLAKCRCPATSEDLAQNVIIKFWRWQRRTQELTGTFDWKGIGGALAKICSDMYCDHLNQNKRLTEFIYTPDDLMDFDCQDDGLQDPYRILISQRSDDAVIKFSDLLHGEWKEMFYDYYYHGLTRPDLAEKYGKTKGSVSTNMCRLRKDLMEYLSIYDLLPEEESVYDQ